MNLDELVQKIRDKKTVIMGIGNEENGDDAAGAFFAYLLEKKFREKNFDFDRLTVINAEKAPENFTGKIRKIKPEIVVLVDAAYLGKEKKVGEIEIFSFKQGEKAENLLGGTFSTHAIPISFLVDYLLSFVKEVCIIAIQVEKLDKFSNMSNEIIEKVHGLVDLIILVLGR